MIVFAADITGTATVGAQKANDPQTPSNLWKILDHTSSRPEDGADTSASDVVLASSECVTGEEEKTTPAEMTETEEELTVAEGDIVTIKVGEEELKELQKHCGGCTARMIRVSRARASIKTNKQTNK